MKMTTTDDANSISDGLKKNMSRHVLTRCIEGMLLLLIVGSIIYFGMRHSAPAIRYTITDLGTLPRDGQSSAEAINAHGDVIGVSAKAFEMGVTQLPHAFLYHNGKMIALVTLPGDVTSRADSINDKGQISGESAKDFNGLNDPGHCVLISHGKMTPLPHASGLGAHGHSINNLGHIITAIVIPPHHYYSGLYVDGRAIDLSKLFGANLMVPFGLNIKDEMCGNIRVPGPEIRAAAYRHGQVIVLGAILGDRGSSASAINDQGQIVGDSWGDRTVLSSAHLSSSRHLVMEKQTVDQAVMFQPGKTEAIPLGLLPGFACTTANAINNRGQIVGNTLGPDSEVGPRNTAALLFQIGSRTPIDLNTCIPKADQARWRLHFAYGINNSGQICGTGTVDGHDHAFLLTSQK